jgi:ATP-dependent 26S proteasome regulatory subunit
VLAATNLPSAIDRALLRPGRFDRLVYVAPPTESERVEILRLHSEKVSFEAGCDLADIARRTEGFTGADLKNLCVRAGRVAYRRSTTADSIAHQDLVEVLHTCVHIHTHV